MLEQELVIHSSYASQHGGIGGGEIIYCSKKSTDAAGNPIVEEEGECIDGGYEYLGLCYDNKVSSGAHYSTVGVVN